MKKMKKIAGMFLLTFILVIAASCGGNADDASHDDDNNNDAQNLTQSIQSPLSSGDEFFFSNGLDENGFWIGVTAANYIEMFNHSGLLVPHDVHYVSDDAIQSEIDMMMSFFPSTGTQIFDREVDMFDTVNIDFVGSVDGVEFAGGSTGGMGTEVTIGITDYIDDFLEQLIGGMPGDTINVEVTFPDQYHEPSLQGAEALFVTTINFIVEHNDEQPELTDDFVLENLSMFYGWSTVEEMREGMLSQFRDDAVLWFVEDYITSSVVVHSIPDAIMSYHEESIISNYRMGAEEYEMDFNDFIMEFAGVTDVEELLEMHQADILHQATFYLVVQAVAEDAGISVGQEDLIDYFLNFTGSPDYSMFEEMYGLPFLKKIVLSQMVLDHMVANAVLE